MVQIANDRIQLRCEADGTGVILHDRHRKTQWRLDERTCLYRTPDGQVMPLGAGRVELLGTSILLQEFQVAGKPLRYRWELHDDGVEIVLESQHTSDELRHVALPGSFSPDGQSLSLALPIMQGVLLNQELCEPFERRLSVAGHEGLSMHLLGYLAERSGLVVSAEDDADWTGLVGQRDDGSLYAHVDAQPSLGAMRYPRRARLYPTDGSVTAICKRYRQRVQERGCWKSWTEKIAERPVVERLFGALMTFIGYNQTGLDYVAECRRLRAFGFDRAFIYPVRFNAANRGFQMGGDDPIHLSDGDIQAIKQLGYEVAPWAWTIEALDDGSEEIRKMYRRGPTHELVPHWKIDDFQWYLCCTPAQTDFVKRAYHGDMRQMSWVHYDVTATFGHEDGSVCHALDHPGHLGEPMDWRADVQARRKLLGPETNGNRVVSSEGFNDTFSTSYDIGTTKLMPAYGPARFWTIPMTMLVYHDSMVHDWWELHNYNDLGCFHNRGQFGEWRNGMAQDKAIMDALYGCPPNVFPFGRNYKWIDIKTRKTGRVEPHFGDTEVQHALSLALPIARLHRQIGKHEMLSHEFLTDDGMAQMTVFGDGTRVFANFADEERPVKGAGVLAPKSWHVTS